MIYSPFTSREIALFHLGRIRAESRFPSCWQLRRDGNEWLIVFERENT